MTRWFWTHWPKGQEARYWQYKLRMDVPLCTMPRDLIGSYTGYQGMIPVRPGWRLVNTWPIFLITLQKGRVLKNMPSTASSSQSIAKRTSIRGSCNKVSKQNAIVKASARNFSCQFKQFSILMLYFDRVRAPVPSITSRSHFDSEYTVQILLIPNRLCRQWFIQLPSTVKTHLLHIVGR